MSSPINANHDLHGNGVRGRKRKIRQELFYIVEGAGFGLMRGDNGDDNWHRLHADKPCLMRRVVRGSNLQMIHVG